MIAACLIEIALLIGKEHDMPANLIIAVIIAESKGDINAINYNTDGTTDLGLMQLNSSWFQGDWRDPETNIRAGAKHLKAYYEWEGFQFNWWEVLIAYNWGITNYVQFKNGGKRPPDSSLEYASKVLVIWQSLEPYKSIKSYGRL